jgi:hypothetical protein
VIGSVLLEVEVLDTTSVAEAQSLTVGLASVLLAISQVGVFDVMSVAEAVSLTGGLVIGSVLLKVEVLDTTSVAEAQSLTVGLASVLLAISQVGVSDVMSVAEAVSLTGGLVIASVLLEVEVLDTMSVVTAQSLTDGLASVLLATSQVDVLAVSTSVFMATAHVCTACLLPEAEALSLSVCSGTAPTFIAVIISIPSVPHNSVFTAIVFIAMLSISVCALADNVSLPRSGDCAP